MCSISLYESGEVIEAVDSIYSFSFDDSIDNELIDAARSKIAGYK